MEVFEFLIDCVAGLFVGLRKLLGLAPKEQSENKNAQETVLAVLVVVVGVLLLVVMLVMAFRGAVVGN